MRSFRLGLGALALLLALGAFAGVAAAKPGYVRVPPHFSLRVELPSRDGYAISVAAPDHRHVAVVAEGHGATATYKVRGTASSDGLAANLGRFGRVDVRFQPTGPVKRSPSKECNGKPTETTKGVAVGTIRLRGRNGFVTVAARRAKAVVTRGFEETCQLTPDRSSRRRAALRPSAPTSAEEELPAIFRAGRLAHGERVRLLAFPPDEVLGLGVLLAFTDQHFGPVEVTAGALKFGALKGLSISGVGEQPATAHVAGPPPFAGDADYESLPRGGSSWTGSLRVHLPGEGAVALAGPGFSASICRPTLKHLKKCFRLFQPSGSQSQSLFDTRLSSSR